MTDIDPLQTAQESAGPAKVEDPPQQSVDPWDWDTIIVPMLWMAGALFLLDTILENGLPGYPGPGATYLVAGLTYLRLRGERFLRYGFAKRAGVCLLLWIAAYALHLVVSLVMHQVWLVLWSLLSNK
jgi:hypothetical protein